MEKVFSKKAFGKKSILVILAVSMVMYMFAGCKKSGDDANQTGTTKATQAASASKTATPKTSTTAKSATQSAGTGTAAATAAQQTNSDNATEIAEETPQGDNSQVSDTDAVDLSGVDFESDEIAVENKGIDLKGATVKLEWYTLTSVPTADATVVKLKILWQNAKTIEQKYNCKIEFSGNVTSTAFYNSIRDNGMAGTESRDFLMGTGPSFYPAFCEQGLFMPIDDYVPKDSAMWKDQIEGLTQ